MQSLASAAQLLAKCTSVESAAPLVAELGFISTPVPLTPESAAGLALPEATGDARIGSAKGPLRVLLFSVTDDIRTVLLRVASIVGTRVPELFVLLVGIDSLHRQVGIAVFESMRSRTRVSALIVDLKNIVDSDAETVCALAAARSESSALTYSRWCEILGRDSINRRFFRELERVVSGLAASLNPSVDRKSADELALICISRLLFLSFLETKGWLDRDHGFLGNKFAECMIAGGSYHRRVLGPLFFGTLNTHPSKRARRAKDFGRIPFLNGGLFARAPIEARYASDFFTDESLGDAFGSLLTRYRFTAREDGTAWTEAAIDPEMLGKAFESLMSSADRKKSGAFYTPQSLVRELCHSALSYGLATSHSPPDEVASALSGSIPDTSAREAMLRSAASVRILDPACGSGAFLVHMLEQIAALRVRLGELRPPHAIRREILTRSIFGVDLNPMAAWLCELRLWLSMAIEDPEPDPLRVTALPNLDRNIRVGDSLSGAAFTDGLPRVEAGRIATVRSRYSRATGPRKRTLGQTLDSMERQCAMLIAQKRLEYLAHERRELLVMVRSPDLFGSRSSPSLEVKALLTRLRRDLAEQRKALRGLQSGGAVPFAFASSFADASLEGGFRIIAGNPPWVRTGNLDLQQRANLRDRYSVYRNASWEGGATIAAAGKGFASQIDAAALFVERCSFLAQPAGTVALILPSKLWRSLAGGGVRRLIAERMELREIDDLTAAPNLFDAAVYPSVVTATRRSIELETSTVKAAAHRRDSVVRWSQRSCSLPFDDSPGSPWIIAPPEVRTAFDKFKRAGIQLAVSPVGRPMLGVKTGCNEAFLVTPDSDVEPSLLRPVIRGDQVREWALPERTERIIWTHDELGPMRVLPRNALKALSPWRRKLESRADCRGRQRWWMLFRTESAACSRPRVVWCDIGKTPRAMVIPAGDDSVPLNTCYVARCRDETDAHSLTALLNSAPIAAWLSLLAEPARGRYLRFMGWTMSLLPLPKDWTRARNLLGPIGIAGAAGAPWEPDDLTRAVLRAYRLSHDELDALLEWNR